MLAAAALCTLLVLVGAPGRAVPAAASPAWTKAASCASATTTTCTSRSRCRSSRRTRRRRAPSTSSAGPAPWSASSARRRWPAAIGRDAGQPVQVVSLAAHQESMGMTLALVDNLPPGPATLAIGLAPIRVTGKPARDATLLSGHELLVRSKRLEQLAPQVLRPRGAHHRRHPRHLRLRGLVPARARHRRTRCGAPRIAYETHYYPWGATGHTQLGKRRNVLYVLAKDVTLYRKYGDYNFAMLEEVLKLARDTRLRRGAVRPAAQRVGRRPHLERRGAGVPQAGGGARAARTTCRTCTSSATCGSPTRTSPTSSTCSPRRASSGSR